MISENGVLSGVQAGPPSAITTVGGDYLLTYCFYNFNLPTTGNYTVEFVNPQNSAVMGTCTFDSATGTGSTQPVLDPNPAPIITGPGSNTTVNAALTQYELSTTIYSYVANESVTWALAGGSDQARFSINSGTGVLAFNVAPNYDTPSDSDANNTYLVTVKATDLYGISTTQNLVVTIKSNLPPTVSTISNLNLCAGTSSNSLSLVVSDDVTPVADLLVSGTSSNPALVPNTNIVLGGSGANRTVVITPLAGQFGTSTITLTIKDTNEKTTTRSFIVTVDQNKVVSSNGITTVIVNAASVFVDNAITINASTNVTNAKVFFSTGFVSGDILEYTGTLPTGVTNEFNAATGVLTFTGSVTPVELENIFRNVKIRTSSTNIQSREITFLAGNALPFEGNNHYYEFVTAPNISWTAAKTAADALLFNGLQGYLATITSAPENDFISSKLSGQGWFGASDVAVEGNWKWMTGPETGQQFWQGTSSGNPVNGFYNKWASGEPNNQGDEDYGHFLANGQWNDYPLSLSGQIQGYVVEYGGMPNEPCISISDIKSVVIVLNQVPTISGIANPTIVCPNSATDPLSFTIGDENTALSDLIISGTSSNTTLVPNANIEFSGTGASRIVTVTPTTDEVGTAIITVVVTDSYTTTASTNFTVTFGDTTLPTITAPVAVATVTNIDCTATGVVLGTPVTADNCSVATVTNDAPTAFVLGATTVTWTVTDGAGNVATATQVVTVTDTTLPTITAPVAVATVTNIDCTATGVVLGTPVTADNCSVATVTNDAPTAFVLGATTVTWTVTDGAGNVATATQVVTVTDTTLPTITAPVAVATVTNTDCTATGVVLGTPVTADNCSVATVTNDAPTAFVLGATTVTWTVTDGAGNVATA
ncbi:lectin-like protein, partial [Flavobacterium sp. TAB 87]|uniref:lectin-like protein n=1 Tax=Flavobacterium sp. TAB 87 TaxID=1729581 RepID=UPI003512CC84